MPNEFQLLTKIYSMAGVPNKARLKKKSTLSVTKNKMRLPL